MIRSVATAMFISIVPALGAWNSTVPAQERDATPPEKFVIEYYYKAKWGFTAEFIRLFKKNYLPVLEEMEREGRILSIVAHAPRHHATEDARWDWRVSVTWRDAITAHEDHHPEEIVGRLFPDREKHAEEERRRFEILLAHWDVLVEEQDLGGDGAHGDDALERVATLHGGAGPFAVAGWRMGDRALRELGAARGEFRLDVLHRTPAEVQWSCVADGLQAATGTSPGRLNLRVEVTSDGGAESAVSIVSLSEKGAGVGRAGARLPVSATFRLLPAFVERFRETPPAQLAGAGQSVLGLRDEEIFEVTIAGR